MSCESTDNEIKLAKEYKSLLSHIRPLIQQLDKSKDAQLCLLWLSKLDQCSRWEKSDRNQILSELCRQVKRKRLEPPFNTQPPVGSLRNILLPTSSPSSCRSDNSLDLECSSEESFTSASLNSSVEKFSEKEFFTKLNGKKSFYENDHSECIAMQKDYQERAMNDQLMVERYQEIINSLVSQQMKTLKSSPKELKKIQMSYEKKISELTVSLKMVEQENEKLKKKVEMFLSHSRLLNEFRVRNETLEKKIAALEETNAILENRQREFEKERTSFADMKNQMSESEKKWMDAERKIREIEDLLESTEKRYEKNLDTYKARLETEMSELEKNYTNELANLERLLEEKENQLSKLKAQDANRSDYDEVSPSKNFKEKKKIQHLKSRLKKLEKAQESMTTAFQTQLQQIITRKDLHIAALEMQLKSKTTESGANIIGTDFNEIFNEKIAELETQYRKMLEESELRANKRRQKDLQKIHDLEKQIIASGTIIEQQTSYRPKSPFSITE